MARGEVGTPIARGEVGNAALLLLRGEVGTAIARGEVGRAALLLLRGEVGPALLLPRGEVGRLVPLLMLLLAVAAVVVIGTALGDELAPLPPEGLGDCGGDEVGLVPAARLLNRPALCGTSNR